MELVDFDGWYAKLLYFRYSHQMLVVGVTAPSGNSRFLVLYYCSRISAPTTWKLSELRAMYSEQCITLFDENANVRIDCESFKILETYDFSGEFQRIASDGP